MNVLVFDIETIPDTEGGRRLHDLDGLSEKEIAEVMFARRRETANGSEFLPHHLHKIVAISAVLRTHKDLKVWSLGSEESSEAELIARFFEGLDKFTPTLVSWNGGGFDLPVLHYRSLVHGVSAPRYWEVGEDDRDFKWNNYLNRFHWRHVDLMDVLSGYQIRAAAPLDEVAQLLGFPGKLGLSGDKVWQTYLDGDIAAIRNYCETDVLNTYLVYLRFQYMRGELTELLLQQEIELVREILAAGGKPHLQEFLEHW